MKTGTFATDRLLLRPIEVAETLGIGRSKAYQLISAGVIPSIRLGGSVRVPLHALRDWMDRQLTSQFADGARS